MRQSGCGTSASRDASPLASPIRREFGLFRFFIFTLFYSEKRNGFSSNFVGQIHFQCLLSSRLLLFSRSLGVVFSKTKKFMILPAFYEEIFMDVQGKIILGGLIVFVRVQRRQRQASLSHANLRHDTEPIALWRGCSYQKGTNSSCAWILAIYHFYCRFF